MCACVYAFVRNGVQLWAIVFALALAPMNGPLAFVCHRDGISHQGKIMVMGKPDEAGPYFVQYGGEAVCRPCHDVG